MRRRGTRRGKHGSRKYSGATVVLLLLLVAAFIYAFQSLGMYDILVKPVFNGTAPAQTTSAVTGKPAPSASLSDSSAVSPSPGALISEEIKLNSVTLYGVQLGVYSKLENAQATSDKFRKDGSAGYLLKEDTLYRVVDSVYYSESDAKAVRDQFRKGASPDACVIRVQASGINWKVTATRQQIDAIRSAVSVFQTQIVTLINTQKAAQQNQGSAGDYQSAVSSAAGKLREAQESLQREVGNTNSVIIQKLDTCLKESAGSLETLAQKEPSDATAYVTGIKYSVIDILLNLQNKIMR